MLEAVVCLSGVPHAVPVRHRNPPRQLNCGALPAAALRIPMRASPATMGPHCGKSDQTCVVAASRRCALPSALCRTIVSLPCALCSITANTDGIAL